MSSPAAPTVVAVDLRPIGNPYPMPSVGTVRVTKSYHYERVGIKVREDVKSQCGVVLVSGLTPGSLIANTNMEVGQEILAVNGKAVHQPNQIVHEIQDNRQVEFTTFDHNVQRLPPFCYVEVAPTSRINPGVSFDSCCNRTMVMVGDIFIADLNNTRLRKGDVVLAVNGVPVWKPEQADEQQLNAARNAKSLVLYCVSMESLHDYVLEHAEKHPTVEGEPCYTAVKKTDATTIRIAARECIATAKLDYQTQLYVDDTGWDKRLKFAFGDSKYSLLPIRNSYAACAMTIEAVNKLLEAQLDGLKTEIVGEAWRDSLQKKENNTGIPTYAVPSAPVAPVAIGTPDQNDATRHSMNIPTAHATPIHDAFEL